MEIFLLEDDPSISNLVKKYLCRDFLVLTFVTCDSVKRSLEDTQNPKIFILDEQLPDGSGIELCAYIREKYHYKSHIIILTKNESINDKLNAYQLGADDYIVKPVNMLELSAKVKNIASRLLEENEEKNFQCHGLYFDLAQMEIFQIINEEKKALEVTPKEFLIIKLLSKNQGSIFSRERILNKVWGEQVSVTDRTVDQHIVHLRKKLVNTSVYIEAVRGEGYKLSVSQS